MRWVKYILPLMIIIACEKAIDSSCSGGGEKGSVCKELHVVNNVLIGTVDYVYDRNDVLRAKTYANGSGKELSTEEYLYNEQGLLTRKTKRNSDKEVVQEEVWEFEGDLAIRYYFSGGDGVKLIEYEYKDSLLINKTVYSSAGVEETVDLYVRYEGDTAVREIKTFKSNELLQVVNCSWFSSTTYKQEFLDSEGVFLGQKIAVFDSNRNLIKFNEYDANRALTYTKSIEYSNGNLVRFTEQNFPGEKIEVRFVVNL